LQSCTFQPKEHSKPTPSLSQRPSQRPRRMIHRHCRVYRRSVKRSLLRLFPYFSATGLRQIYCGMLALHLCAFIHYSLDAPPVYLLYRRLHPVAVESERRHLSGPKFEMAFNSFHLYFSFRHYQILSGGEFKMGIWGEWRPRDYRGPRCQPFGVSRNSGALNCAVAATLGGDSRIASQMDLAPFWSVPYTSQIYLRSAGGALRLFLTP
jgi:hypothetical protein